MALGEQIGRNPHHITVFLQAMMGSTGDCCYHCQHHLHGKEEELTLMTGEDLGGLVHDFVVVLLIPMDDSGEQA